MSVTELFKCTTVSRIKNAHSLDEQSVANYDPPFHCDQITFLTFADELINGITDIYSLRGLVRPAHCSFLVCLVSGGGTCAEILS